ncbi:hypothetical protein EV361DRAFT_864081 [Lentinula raphanica]|nr:hypothetical protein EV361DRAFT_864081 [Lentinula raphanica]
MNLYQLLLLVTLAIRVSSADPGLFLNIHARTEHHQGAVNANEGNTSNDGHQSSSTTTSSPHPPAHTTPPSHPPPSYPHHSGSHDSPPAGSWNPPAGFQRFEVEEPEGHQRKKGKGAAAVTCVKVAAVCILLVAGFASLCAAGFATSYLILKDKEKRAVGSENTQEPGAEHCRVPEHEPCNCKDATESVDKDGKLSLIPRDVKRTKREVTKWIYQPRISERHTEYVNGVPRSIYVPIRGESLKWFLFARPTVSYCVLVLLSACKSKGGTKGGAA